MAVCFDEVFGLARCMENSTGRPWYTSCGATHIRDAFHPVHGASGFNDGPAGTRAWKEGETYSRKREWFMSGLKCCRI